MIPSQMFKGILEGCVLEVIRQQETYAYEISEKLKAAGFGEISEGTIYPIILRLNKNGLLASKLRESPVGPKRKYYRLTDAGLAELETFKRSFGSLKQAIETLFAEDV